MSLLSALAGLAIVTAATAAPGVPPPGTVHGTVVDSLTGEAVARVGVWPEAAPARSVLTDPSGRFTLAGLAQGAHRLVLQHVAYAPASVLVVLTPGSASDSIRVALSPQARVLDLVRVEADRVTPLTSRHTTSYVLPPRLIAELPIDGGVELVSLIPGVVVAGDRPFFRGLGLEHVVPLIDGVPARDPIDGEWILPPPDAVGSAEFVAGAFGVEHGAIGGVFDVRMAEGGPRRALRVTYDSDRFDAGTTSRSNTDSGELAVSGPTRVPSLFFAAAWKGRLTDTPLTYDHARGSHTFLGSFDLGERMAGDQSASFRLSHVPGASTAAGAGDRKLALTVLHAGRRAKRYHDNYSRSGWVGYEEVFSRYTTFVESPTDADSVVWYDGPAHVPASARRSTLVMATYEHRLGESALGLHARLADHRYETRPFRGPLESADAVRSWIRRHVTDADDQTEWFYATHGDVAAFDDAHSVEGSIGVRARAPAGRHALAFGAGGTLARHRLAGLVRGLGGPVVSGSFDQALRSFDGFAYVQDTWKADSFSSVTLGIRADGRAVDGYLGTARATVVSPRIGFHQPMTDVDALHVQAGTVYQFPTYRVYFPASVVAGEGGITLAAQRTRAFEIGIQHHVSRAVVTYLNLYVRAGDDVVFAQREEGVLDFVFPDGNAPSATPIVTRGAELTIDHQLHPGVVGQLSLSVGKTTIDDEETPWSRRSTVRGWLRLSPDRRVRAALSGRWDSGRPYSVCIKPRNDCLEHERFTGRMPGILALDGSVRWSLGTARAVRLVGEVRNILDRRGPSFAFGVGQSNVETGNFIAYYDAFGKTGGYLVDVGDRFLRFDIDNPATLGAGRNVRLGIQLDL